jgi:hypothetical protein
MRVCVFLIDVIYICESVIMIDEDEYNFKLNYDNV